MNEKFFDLKKEKQDRMLNAAMKIFADNGYKRASTDEIVKEAGISKGLLFHYFTSKLGLYTFLTDYSTRYIRMELIGNVSIREDNYFEIRRQIEAGRAAAMKNFPYIQKFLNVALQEAEREASEATKEKREQYLETYREIYRRVNFKPLQKKTDVVKLRNMIEYTINGLLADFLNLSDFKVDVFYQEALSYIDLCEKAVEASV